MKKSKIIIIICLIIAIVTTIVFLSKSSKKDDALDNNNDASITETTDSQETIVQEGEKTNSEKIKYWVEEYNFPKETNEFNLNLYGFSFNGLMKLTDLEPNCDYFEYTAGMYPNREKHKVEKISDINATLNDGSELNVYLYMNDETRPELTSFTIKNLTEESKTAQECIANGWWYIHDEYFDEKSVGLIYSGDKYASEKDMILLEEIIQKLGRPTKIVPLTGDIEDKTGDFGLAMYYIVYEYSDYILGLLVNETLYFDSNNRGIFEIAAITYYPQQIKEERYYYTTEGNLLK